MEKMKSMMDKMSPEDMQKWAGRAQKVASFAATPISYFNKLRGWLNKIGSAGVVALLAGLLAIMYAGHVTDTF